jgi:hypothetical protein
VLAAWQITITRNDITLGIALLGASLGIWNAWSGWRRDRISLRVVPKLYRLLPQGILSWSVDDASHVASETDISAMLCIEINNNSRCAVTLEEVGFYHPRASARFVLIEHFLSEEQGKLPFRLEAFSAVTVYADYSPQGLFRKPNAVKYAYVRTGHGGWFKGTSPVLKRLIREEFQ